MPGIAVVGSGGLADGAAPNARSLDGSTRLNSLTPCRSRESLQRACLIPQAGSVLLVQCGQVRCSEQADFRDWLKSSSLFERALESLKSLSTTGLASKNGVVVTRVAVGQNAGDFDARISAKTVKLSRGLRGLLKP